MLILLKDLYFSLRSPQNCKKSTFLDNLRTVTQEGNIETRQIPPFFCSLFPLQLFITFILYLKTVKIHLHVVPPLVHSSL